MKQLSLGINFVLLAAVAILFYFQFSGKSGAPAEPVAEKPVPVDTILKPTSDLTIAYVNRDTIWEKYDMVNDKLAELERKKTQMETDISQKMLRLQQDGRTLEEKVYSGEIAIRSVMEEKQMELLQREQELGEEGRRLQMKLLKIEEEKTKEVMESINNFLETLNQKRNFTLILSYGVSSDVMLIDKAMNITDEVVNGLNEEYAASKAPKESAE